jgi:hypothetical protein
MGFTEAELGFILAAVFAGLAVSGLAAEERQATASARSDSLRIRYDSVSKAFAAFRDSVRKKSNKTPRCSEKGERPDAIATLRILGSDAYDLDGERLTFAGVESRFSGQIKHSATLGCHYLVRAVAVSGVDSPAYSAAVSKLSNRFDVSERQP